ncbi:hypothetical protein ElyMa_000230200 [Elysia marginata]|uniref:Death domain-containing protein n=1 Tax=Elysia marginata TaxID=1093978 RepID=A0AAV4F0L1_9GAST|nr:hypothetical protein ElyMa_000230200 [Elysia marginata]
MCDVSFPMVRSLRGYFEIDSSCRLFLSISIDLPRCYISPELVIMPVPERKPGVDSLGPYCDDFGITKADLKGGVSVRDRNTEITNGLVLEVLKYWKQRRADETTLDTYFSCIFPSHEIHMAKLSAQSLSSRRESMRIQKDRAGIDELESQPFEHRHIDHESDE